jgi:hypothetical protein
MISVTVSSVALALFTACELSTGARRLGADLLGSAAGCCGTITEAVDSLAGRVGVSWNRARVLLGELSRAGFVTYWSYTAAGQRWCCVSWLAWVVGVPRVMPPAEAGEDFTRNVSGEVAQSEAGHTRSVSGDCDHLDCDRSGVIGSSVVVVQQTNSCCLDIKQTTTACAHARVCEDSADGSSTSPVTENVSGDPDADRILALLTDPEVGMPVSMARRSASFGDFWRVVGNVFEWRRQRDAGTLRSPHAALSHRLLKGWEGVILDTDRYSELWERHCRPVLAASYTRNVLGDGPDMAAPIAASEIGSAEMATCELAVTQNVSGVIGAPSARAVPAVTENVSGEKTPAEAWWEQVVAEFAIDAGGTFERWLSDTSVASYDASTNSFVVAVPDRFRIDWLRNRLARGVARKLSVITHRQASVSFILAADALGEAA